MAASGITIVSDTILRIVLLVAHASGLQPTQS